MYDLYISSRHSPLAMYYTGWLGKYLGTTARIYDGYDRIRNGEFPEDLKRRIEKSRNFIVVLTSDSFGRYNDENNWVIDEIETAINTNANIIPVVTSDFVWSETLPNMVKRLKEYNNITIEISDYTSMPPSGLEFVIKLIEKRLISNKKESVFISYSTADQEIADKTKQILKDNRIVCWMAPDSIRAGGDYAEEIPAAIKKCEIFLLILSENSQKSIWVPKELSLAVQERKTIIPFHIDKSSITSKFEFYLTDEQIITSHKDENEAYWELCEVIHDTLNKIK